MFAVYRMDTFLHHKIYGCVFPSMSAYIRTYSQNMRRKEKDVKRTITVLATESNLNFNKEHTLNIKFIKSCVNS